MPLPPVGGVKVLDVDPSLWGLADGTALTFANSGLTPVLGNPTMATNAFDNAAPAVRIVRAAQGFSVARPVQDDFTLYMVALHLSQSGVGGAAWYNAASLMDSEQAGSVNDFGININENGGLRLGTGNPDTSVNGAALVTGPGVRVIIAVTRVKATGVMKAYVNGVLDATLTNNVNSLNAQANLYVGSGSSGGKVGGLFGRILAYDAAHSGADLAAMYAQLSADYPFAARLLSTKFTPYAAVGVPPAVLAATKFSSYVAEGPGNPGTLASTKFVVYGVIASARGASRPQIF